MIKRIVQYWNESTTFGKIVLVMCIVPALILGMFDYVWVKIMDIGNKFERWRYETFWILKRDKENYERRNSNKS